MKRIITLLVAVLMLAALALPSFAAVTDPAIDTETKLLTAETTTDTSNTVLENASDMPTRADLTAFKSAFSDLFTQLNALRATARANWISIKAINADIKKAMADFKNSLSGLGTEERKAKVKALRDTLKTSHESVKVLHADIKNIRANKRAQWSLFRKAVKVRNKDAAQAALQSIINLKSQIIDKQILLLAAKAPILAAIKLQLPLTV